MQSDFPHVPPEARARLIAETTRACAFQALERTPFEDLEPRITADWEALAAGNGVFLKGDQWQAVADLFEPYEGHPVVILPFRAFSSEALPEIREACAEAFQGRSRTLWVPIPVGHEDRLLEGLGPDWHVLGDFSVIKIHRMKVQKLLGRQSYPQFKVTHEWNMEFFEGYRELRGSVPLEIPEVRGLDAEAFFSSQRVRMERLLKENRGGIIGLYQQIKGNRKRLVALVAIEWRYQPDLHLPYYHLLELVILPELQRQGIARYLHLVSTWKATLEQSPFAGGLIRRGDEPMSALARGIHREPVATYLAVSLPVMAPSPP